MFLAAISFSDPIMLAGLLAALVPILLHLLNRMRAPVVPFPTLRFLRITAQKTARRRQIQQYFLLLARVLVFALIATAVAAPLIRGGNAGLAYGFVAMLLGGLVLLVLAGVMGAAAMDTAKTAGRAPAGAAAPAKRRNAGPYWGFALAALLAAMLLGGYSAYGLISDRFFAGDKGEFSGRSTAAVIIFDNSYSMLATEDSRTRLARAKEQVRQLLGESIRPAEAAILPTNPGDSAAAAPPPLTADATRLLGYLDRVNAQGSALPMQERIRTALNMLAASSQPFKMLIIVSDFARPAFADAEVFGALKGVPWRSDLQVVLMPIGAGAGVADAGIASLSLAQGTQRPAVGAELIFEAQIINNNDTADVRDLVFTVDGKPAEAPAGGPLSPRVQLGPAGSATARATVRIPYRPTQPGWHRFGIEFQGNGDAMTWDDRRELALNIADQVPVLLVGAEPADSSGRPRARSSAFYFLAALAPFQGRTTSQIPWPIKPAYRGVDELRDPAAFSGNAAVFLCDLPKVPASLAGALQAFAQSGGRIVWVLGPSVDAAAYNQALLADGRDLLPAPLDQPLVSATAWPLDWVDLHAGLFMNLYESQEPFRALLVIGRWSLKGELTRGRVLAKLSDGAPICIQHAQAAGGPGSDGGGTIYTLLTSPAAAWSNLGATSLLVPLASRMALGDFAESHSQTDIESGRPFTWRAADIDPAAFADTAALRGVSLDITLPDGTIINVTPTPPPAGTSPLWTFDRTHAPGLYRWKASDARHEGLFAVNPPADEADLLPADVEALARESNANAPAAGKPTIVATGTADLLGQLERRSEGTSLTPGFLAMVLILAVIEMLMSNRHRPEAGIAPEAAPA